MPFCCSCNPTSTLDDRNFPYLCDACKEEPYRINLCDTIGNLLQKCAVGQLSEAVFYHVVEHVHTLCAARDTNPAPVIVGLIFTELYADGGKVLMIKRAIEPHIGEWALVSGYIIDTLNWRGNLRKETLEEATVLLSALPEHMVPFAFETNEPNTNRILNFAVVMPEGVIRINEFVHNREASDRMEFRFSRTERPTFCFPLHQQMFDAFCALQFGW